MSKKNEKYFSYELWGDLTRAKRDGNRFDFEMNPKYGQGKSISLYYETAIYPTLCEYNLSAKFNKQNIYFFKEDSIYLGKVLKGNVLIKGENKLNILFSEGDIFCISGNYKLGEKYILENNISIKTIGIFGYFNEIINAFNKNNWDPEIITTLLNSRDLKTGIKISKTYDLEKILDDLYISMKEDTRFVAYVKSLELFHYFIGVVNDKRHKKAKTYTEKQVEIVIRIKKFLDENLDNYYSMPKLAEMFNISLSRMQSIFKDYYGLSPYKYHLNKRLEKAHHLILNSDIKISQIAELVGFNSYDKFFLAYKNKYNASPSKFRI